MSVLRTLAGAAAAAVALTMSASAASACWGGCGYQTYVPPPVLRPACGCCGGCGYQSYAPTFSYMPYAQPAYHVDQGPSYDVPPPAPVEPVPEEYGYPRRPWVGGYGYRRHFVGYRGYHHGYGYRGYHGYGHRYWRGYGPVRVRG